MPQITKYFIFFFALTYASFSFAGGPLILQGVDGHTPVSYEIPDITMHVEAGILGTRTNEQTQILMTDGFNLWSNVDTATVNLTVNQTLVSSNVDIDGTNFETYLPKLDDSSFNADDNLNPVVFDDNGEIIDAYFGGTEDGEDRQSDYIIGFAESIFTQNGDYFLEGYLVINGRQLGILPRTDAELTLLFAHEVGHFIGLDHSQANIDNQESVTTVPQTLCSDRIKDKYPVMYPYECRENDTLHPDDISAVTELYPAASLTSNFGIIEGYFVDENNRPILGANIWAEEDIVTGDAYSIVSDYLKQGNGYYRLLLPAGNYTLHANSVNPVFFGGSSVGPYALEIDSISFLTPHPITPVSYQDNETITVSAGEILSINFSSVGASVSQSSIIFQEESSGGGITSPITLLLLFLFLLTVRNKNYLKTF